MKKIFIYILAVISISLNVQAQKLEIGAAFRNISPNMPVLVSGGTGAPSPASIKNGELTTRALVITKGDVKIAIVSIDNLGIPKVVGDRIRALVPQIKAENIVIGATHTHSAPDVYGFADEKGNSGTDLKYIDMLVTKTAEAINEAYKNAKPAYLKVAVGEAKGKIAYNYYAPKLYDPRAGVMQFISAKNGKTIATLVNYATHPEIIGSDRNICTPDLVGPLYAKIEAETGGMAIFMNSAQGGMVTADNRRENGKEANDWNECIRIGELLATESLRIIADADLQKDPQIFITSSEVKLPVESDLMKFILKHALLKYDMNKNGEAVTRMNLLNIGTAQVITIPGEALPNIGFYLKRNMNTNNPFLFGLTNDAFGYIITKEDFNGFKRYKYICETSLGEKTAEIIEDTALELVKKSPAAK
jgi:hypothetical protein